MPKPRSNQTKKLLEQEFGTCEFVEATAPFPYFLDKDSINKGSRRRINKCPHRECLMSQRGVAAALVMENFSYLLFAGGKDPIRYQNPTEMTYAIKVYDQDGEMEEGDFVLLVPTGARSLKYKKTLKDRIKKGLHKPKKRGPNLNGTKQPAKHFRPY